MVCCECAEKIVNFHVFYLMYLKSDQILRERCLKNDSETVSTLDASLAANAALIDDVQAENVSSPQTSITCHLKFNCSSCSDRFQTKRALSKHLKTCINAATTANANKCDDSIELEAILSKQNANRAHKYRGHMRTISNSRVKVYTRSCATQEATVAKNPDASGRWLCNKCSVTCPSKVALREHRKIHRQPKKYKENPSTGEYICDVCSKTFDTKEKIQFHVRRHGDIKCLCNVCGKWLSCRDNLNKHYRAVHLNEKKHVCPICSHRFTSSFRLKDHVNSHKGIRAYSCELCATRFFNCSAVKRHMDTVHCNEKKHVCTVCSKAFKLPTNLKTHMFAHTGIYEFTCDQCGIGFRRKNKMLQHIQETHVTSTTISNAPND